MGWFNYGDNSTWCHKTPEPKTVRPDDDGRPSPLVLVQPAPTPIHWGHVYKARREGRLPLKHVGGDAA